MNLKLITSLFVCVVLLLLCSCKKPHKNISFYYWKTNVAFGQAERKALKENNVDTLFVRYFDIEFNATDPAPHPVGVIRFNDSISQVIVPVVYIKNNVFEKSDSAAIVTLASNANTLISQINRFNNLHVSELQFDCDWTDKTQKKYFYFLSLFKDTFHVPISATIRLHQIKYKERTGVPPVRYGVLMYYNMSDIDASGRSSVYDKNTAAKYNSFIKQYPLPLVPALPIFTWGIQIRDNKVVALLNKMSAGHFAGDSNFTLVKDNRFVAKNACFKGGYYFKKDDEVKIENINKDQLMEMSDDIVFNPKFPATKVLFYDLDSINISQYEEGIFKKVAGNMH